MEYKKINKKDNRITLRLDKDTFKKLEEEAKIKDKGISTVIKDYIDRRTVGKPEMNTDKEFPTLHLKLVDADVIIGPRFGKPDPYVSFLEQFEIKIIQGKKIIILNIPRTYYDNISILGEEKSDEVFNDLIEFGNKWKEAIFEYKKILSSLVDEREAEEEGEKIEKNKIHIFLDIIDLLEKKFGTPIPKEEIIKAALEKEISEEESGGMLRRLKLEGTLFEPKINYIERIR